MILDRIIHGTQYYRSPTPLENEWDEDLNNMGEYGLDTIQIRMNWRWNERIEGVYDFSDVDKLLELAKKNNKKVIIKFLLECAPQYVFEKYGGQRIHSDGSVIRPGSHGAFYVGGWLPCFTNPKVQDAARKFVEVTAKRYASDESIIFWNVWNEFRNRPYDECYCDHCRNGFGNYLKNKFKTIENLNKFYGVAEESFETIALPSMPHGYWDIFEFKKYKGSKCISENLTFAYDAIRKYDKVRPIMSHVGVCSAFQQSLEDVSDEYNISKSVDFTGTSIPFSTIMKTHDRRLDYQLLTDYMYTVNKDYFIYELYPGLGMFRDYDDNSDMDFKTYSSLSGGSKGILYWQYRSERLGMESDCSGLVRMDGSKRPVCDSVKKYAEDLNKDMEIFKKSEPEKADIAIMFDFDSMLLSEIEDSCGYLNTFYLFDPLFYYNYSHRGIYRLLRDENYKVDYVMSSQTDNFKNYKCIFVPYYSMIKEETRNALDEFIKNGGYVIADEGFGMRTLNTWMNPYDIDLGNVIKGRLSERRRGEFPLKYNGEVINVGPYRSEYNLKNGSPVLEYDDGKTALTSFNYGKGKFYLAGFSIGYTYYKTNSESIAALCIDLIKDLPLKKYEYSNVREYIYEKELIGNGNKTIFLFNYSDKVKKYDFNDKEIISSGGTAKMENKTVTLEPNTISYIVIKE